MKQHTVRLHPLGKTFKMNDQTPLIDVLHEFGIEFPCGGKGTCGKCKVKLLSGEIETTPQHQQKLDELKLESNWRLACMSRCTSDIILEVEQFSHLILADETDFEFTPRKGFGVAVDLGTTTLVAQLIDLLTAQVLAVETQVNPQVKYGADLISRIQACLDGKALQMARSIRETVGKMILAMLAKHNVVLDQIILVGNTAMQRIFSQLDVAPLSQYPFEIDNSSIQQYDLQQLRWGFPCHGPVQFMPSIGSFVGSDILAGIAATKLHQNEKYTALIDLGTNGEIVIGNNQQIVCASTAAGPAFEGANISMGMRAVTGAISSLELIDGEFKATVIGNTTPKGICGSALIDAIALLRQQDKIGIFGEINSEEQSVSISGKVLLTQKDIHEFQLAKAAIAAGLEILSQELEIKVNDIDQIYIAGGFGSYINLEHVVSAGMIETEPEKIIKMGNTALIGAKLFLYENQQLTKEILSKTRHINLEGNPNFQDIYINKMIFPR
ncbi:MAG TPA: ASKHA domain-containing protein [Sunxiuqinia sp.]|nr:ASKHA domain-containing protein [Sunxiuqinia sp.]